MFSVGKLLWGYVLRAVVIWIIKAIMNSIWKNDKFVDDILRNFFDEFFEERISREELLYALDNGGYFKFDRKLHVKEGKKVRLSDLFRMAVMLDIRISELNHMIKTRGQVLHSHKPKSSASFRNTNSAVYRYLKRILEDNGDNGFKERINRLYDEKQGEG